MKKQTKKGFTLVELVIVIAVIAILSAILIPTFGNVISQAKENAAKEDARTAYQQFLMDNKDNDIVTSENYTAYILVDATKDTNITGAKYVYSFTDGASNKVEYREVAGSDNGTITIVTTPTAGSACELSKTGMYIVFKTKTATGE